MKRGLTPLVMLVFGCGAQPEALPPYGEVLIAIDTNVAVPKHLGRVRIDLFDDAGTWFESRDFATPNATDFPLSMSVYNGANTATRSVLVRVRGYAEGSTRDYLGERFSERPTFRETATANSLSEACALATPVELGRASSARLPSTPFTDGALGCELAQTKSGLVAFRFEIERAGEYRVELSDAVPGPEWSFVADTLLSLRTSCEDVTTELACNNDSDVTFNRLSGLTLELAAGHYFAVVGNVARNPMDVTLQLRPADAQGAQPEQGLPTGVLESSAPRLLAGGLDVTPLLEPEPSLTIDRLALISVEPERRSTARLLLDGECMGAMADAAGRRSCLRDGGTLEALEPETLLEGRLRAWTSLVGSWHAYAEPSCSMDPPASDPQLFDERVCVGGGAFVLGEPAVMGRGADHGRPERVAVLRPFFLDRYEYTVGRYRNAKRRGFQPPDGGPLNNFEPVMLDGAAPERSCTWNETLSGASLHPGQENLPLSCVSWLTARALCRFEGGDLPTVAEREYVAAAHGRSFEELYPWGEDSPRCDTALFGRWIDPSNGSTECEQHGAGPMDVNAEPWASADQTRAGVVGLGGSVAEWTLDSHRAYDDACWQSQPHESPRCWEEEAPMRTIMGASWRDPAGRTRSAMRIGGAAAGTDPSVGFRCRYPGESE